MNQKTDFFMVNSHKPPTVTRRHTPLSLIFMLMAVSMPTLGFADFISPVIVNSNAKTDTYADNQITVAHGENNTWVAVWSSLGPNPVSSDGSDPTTGNYQNEDLYFSRSTDNGKTWSTRSVLKRNASSDNADDIDPSIATDGQGHWMVVWRSKDTLDGTIGYDNDILMTMSSDNGLTWSYPSAVNTDATSDPGGFSNASTFMGDHNPQVCSDGQGHWIVNWIRYDSSERSSTGLWKTSIMSAASSDNGSHWTPPYTVKTNTGQMYNLEPPTLTTDGHGHWMTAWAYAPVTYDDFDIYYAVSNNNGATWSSPAPLNTNSGDDSRVDRLPRLATDGQGHWMAVWQSDENLGGSIGTDNDILFATSNNNGQSWSAPSPLNSDAATDVGSDTEPRLIYDGAGNWVAAWNTGKLGGDNDFCYSVTPVGNTSWPAAVPLNPWALTDDATAGDCFMNLAPGTPGYWMALWSTTHDLGAGNAGNDLDICATLYDPNFTFAPNIVAVPTMLKFTNGTGLEVDVTKDGQPTTATLTIKNDGTAPLTLKGLQFNGSHADDFWILQMPALPSVLKADTSCSMVIQFKPKETHATFSMLGNLVLYSNDPDQPYLTVPLIGDAVPSELTGFTIE